jgi:hypothetical protein
MTIGCIPQAKYCNLLCYTGSLGGGNIKIKIMHAYTHLKHNVEIVVIIMVI